MEPRDLEYFAVIGETRNLRRAAEALDMSQPALSKSLRRLEKWARAKLVKRTPNGVELTDVGSTLLTHARRMKLYLEDVGHEVADLGQGRAGHLRIGAPPGYVDTFLTPACTRFLTQSPKLTLNIQTGDIGELFLALRNGEVDLNVSGIPASPYSDLVHERLFDDAYVVYASARHRLVRRKRLTIADLAKERWALPPSGTIPRQILIRGFEERGLPPPTVAMEATPLGPRFDLVASSDVLGLASRRGLRAATAHLRLTELHVAGLPWIRAVCVFYRENAYLSPAARRFVEILKTTAKETAGDS